MILLLAFVLFGWNAGRLLAQQPCGSWRFLVGVQMPVANQKDVRNGIDDLGKVTLYFKPMPPVTPVCEVTFAVREASIVDVKQGWVTIIGKPDTRIDIGCTLPEGKPR